MITLKKFIKQCMFLFLIFFLFTPTINAQATTGGNGGGDDGGEGSQKVVGGPYYTHTGWLTYIIDENNNQITDTKVFYSSSDRPSSSCELYQTTKFGGSTNNFVADRFSTNQKSANTLNFIGSEILFGYSVSQICVAVTTGTAVGGPIIAAIGAGIILLGAMFSILAEGD